MNDLIFDNDSHTWKHARRTVTKPVLLAQEDNPLFHTDEDCVLCFVLPVAFLAALGGLMLTAALT